MEGMEYNLFPDLKKTGGYVFAEKITRISHE
jgi:hypothetical protein